MPKLLAFLTCERVIIGVGDNAVSLIVIVHQLHMKSFGKNEAPADDTAVLVHLSLFSQWQFLPGDEGKTFEASYTLGSVGGEPKFRVEAPEIKKTTAPIHRLIATIEAVPFLQPGQYELALWIREKGNEWPKTALAQYPIEVTHAAIEASAQVHENH